MTGMDHGSASLGFGVERHIEKSRAAGTADEKVEHLTCAVEALLMHLNHLEGEARAADARGASKAEEANGG
ncbi:MAG TPA: hypothetical protein VF601_08855 [Beijerinckiaceae bacterium]|jgi:hypothetical protein